MELYNTGQNRMIPCQALIIDSMEIFKRQQNKNVEKMSSIQCHLPKMKHKRAEHLLKQWMLCSTELAEFTLCNVDPLPDDWQMAKTINSSSLSLSSLTFTGPYSQICFFKIVGEKITTEKVII